VKKSIGNGIVLATHAVLFTPFSMAVRGVLTDLVGMLGQAFFGAFVSDQIAMLRASHRIFSITKNLFVT
jgi:hypothetical protein